MNWGKNVHIYKLYHIFLRLTYILCYLVKWKNISYKDKDIKKQKTKQNRNFNYLNISILRKYKFTIFGRLFAHPNNLHYYVKFMYKVTSSSKFHINTYRGYDQVDLSLFLTSFFMNLITRIKSSKLKIKYKSFFF